MHNFTNNPGIKTIRKKLHTPTRMADMKYTVSNISRTWSNGKPGMQRGDATTSEIIGPQIAKSVHTDPQCSSQLNTNPPALHQDTRTWTPQPQEPNLKPTRRPSQADAEMNHAHSYEGIFHSNGVHFV